MKPFLFHLSKALILTIIAMVFSIYYVHGQGVNWKIDGNNNINENANFIGTINYAGFSIRTNNVNRFNITKDGKVNILGDCFIKGKLNGDSIKFNKVAIDSLHVGTLKIGDHSLWIGNIWSGSSGTYQDYIQSNNGVINIGNENLLNFSNITLGIGKQLTFPSSINIRLDVAGHVNIDNTFGYCIGGTATAPVEVLQYHGAVNSVPDTTNIFVGVGA